MKTKTVTLSTKVIALALAGVLVLGGAIGGTLAWLLDTSKEVTNTFTYGDINIELWETEKGEGVYTENHIYAKNFEILPGTDLKKDPTVTVEAGSEKCWLFIKVTDELSSLVDVQYSIDSKWISTGIVDETTGTTVYYMVVDESTANQSYAVLTRNLIEVSEDLTKDEINTIYNESGVTPTELLTIIAYAVQFDAVEYNTEGIDDASKELATAKLAWAITSDAGQTDNSTFGGDTSEE